MFILWGSRRLHGRRGLKLSSKENLYTLTGSPPSRAAWIEMNVAGIAAGQGVSPPSRAAWIEMLKCLLSSIRRMSPPSRAAWIEIKLAWLKSADFKSPPSRAAWIEISRCEIINIRPRRRRLHGRRGLKFQYIFSGFPTVASPPSRAAWIEIFGLYKVADSVHVAAFTGGVD